MIGRPWRIFLFAVLASSLLACTGDRFEPVFDVEINDRPDGRRFDLALKSYDSRYLCLEFEAWPNKFGQIHMGGAVLETSSGVYEAEIFNFGYCPGGCGVFRIPPNGRLEGFIGYSQFEAEIDVEGESDRRLIFSASPHLCDE